MISFKGVTKIYSRDHQSVVALKNVFINIKKGEFVSVVGKSGAGKTTLIKLLLGEEKPTQGRVLFEGKDVPEMRSKELQRLRQDIGVVYQDYKLIPSKTVRENVEYIMQVIGALDRDIARDVPQVLSLVGLGNRQSHYPQELSGGEKQRLSIARALIHRPKVIIADEPTGNLDIYNTFEIISLLKKIHSFGTTVILASHDRNVIESLKKRVITLEDGRVLHDSLDGKFIL